MKLLTGVIVLAGLWLTVPVRADDRAGRPNIILLVSDDQRPDTVQALGNKFIRTPHLDELVRTGSAFTRATCANPICTPSRAEILSGRCSFRNGVGDFGGRLREEMPLLGGWLQGAGYQTWYVGKWHNDGAPTTRGYDRTNGLYRGGGGRWWKPHVDWAGRPVTGYRGWIFQDDQGTKFPEHGVGLTADISARFADAAIELIAGAEDKPFFLHVNFTAPHDPLFVPTGYADRYDPDQIPLPPNFQPQHPFDHGNFRGRDEQLFGFPRTEREVREELAVYYAVIEHLDAQVGRIQAAIDAGGLRENTIVIFASDHGLGVGSHGLRGKQSMYEHTIGVPLLMAGPGIPATRRFQAQCYLRDIFPTVCELAGVELPKGLDGRSLVPVLRGTQQEVHPFVVGYFRNFQRMIRAGQWKYVEYPQVDRQQLFDLRSDPHELTNLIDEPAHQAHREQLVKQLRQWQRTHDDPLGSGVEDGESIQPTRSSIEDR